MEVFWTGVFTLGGVALGSWIGWRMAERQSTRSEVENAYLRTVEALASTNNLLWDYAYVASEPTAVDLSRSRVAPEELTTSSDRWRDIRPAMTAVSIGDPSPEIRHRAGELVRAMSLFTRLNDSADRSEKSVRLLATHCDGCSGLLLDIEKRNLARRGALERRWWRRSGEEDQEPELDRLKGDTRFNRQRN